MKLTTYSDYVMRVLMVAAAKSPELTTIREVARSFAIAETHVVKCVHRLGAWGYLETVRGRGGGFRLARPASAIRVGEVMRRTEEDFAVVECLGAQNTCRLIGRCKLSDALHRATQAFLGVLDDLTLADLCDDGPALLGLIGLPAQGRAPRCLAAALPARPTD